MSRVHVVRKLSISITSIATTGRGWRIADSVTSGLRLEWDFPPAETMTAIRKGVETANQPALETCLFYSLAEEIHRTAILRVP